MTIPAATKEVTFQINVTNEEVTNKFSDLYINFEVKDPTGRSRLLFKNVKTSRRKISVIQNIEEGATLRVDFKIKNFKHNFTLDMKSNNEFLISKDLIRPIIYFDLSEVYTDVTKVVKEKQSHEPEWVQGSLSSVIPFKSVTPSRYTGYKETVL